MVQTRYTIFAENGSKFCECVHDADGTIHMIAKNGEVDFQNLQAQALNPSVAMKKRGKRNDRKSSKKICNF
ncbi:MAG: hypothetical protein SO101_07490 [Lachnospiraceae bacterium]|nr:hypothetical protein [Lachnospiraceae bacterium]